MSENGPLLQPEKGNKRKTIAQENLLEMADAVPNKQRKAKAQPIMDKVVPILTTTTNNNDPAIMDIDITNTHTADTLEDGNMLIKNHIKKVIIRSDEKKVVLHFIDELINSKKITPVYPLTDEDYSIVKEALKNCKMDSNDKVFNKERYNRLTKANLDGCHSKNLINIREKKAEDRLSALIEEDRKKLSHEVELKLKCDEINNRILRFKDLYAEECYVKKQKDEIKPEFIHMSLVYNELSRYASSIDIVNATCSLIYNLQISLAKKCTTESWSFVNNLY